MKSITMKGLKTVYKATIKAYNEMRDSVDISPYLMLTLLDNFPEEVEMIQREITREEEEQNP